jgi:hypothetical protein
MTDERCAQCQLPIEQVPDEPACDVDMVCGDCEAIHNIGTVHLFICLSHMEREVPADISRKYRAVFYRWN